MFPVRRRGNFQPFRSRKSQIPRSILGYLASPRLKVFKQPSHLTEKRPYRYICCATKARRVKNHLHGRSTAPSGRVVLAMCCASASDSIATRSWRSSLNPLRRTAVPHSGKHPKVSPCHQYFLALFGCVRFEALLLDSNNRVEFVAWSLFSVAGSSHAVTMNEAQQRKTAPKFLCLASQQRLQISKRNLPSGKRFQGRSTGSLNEEPISRFHELHTHQQCTARYQTISKLSSYEIVFHKIREVYLTLMACGLITGRLKPPNNLQSDRC